jgi:hypothetical protein
LDEAHRRLWIRLASVSRFSVALSRAAAEQLIDALERMGTCAVPTHHDDGPRLLCVQPNRDPSVIPVAERRCAAFADGCPMRMYLHLSEDAADRIDVTFTHPVTRALLDHLRVCHEGMESMVGKG